jgi:hypothetical protein
MAVDAREIVSPIFKFFRMADEIILKREKQLFRMSTSTLKASVGFLESEQEV